MDNNNVNEIDDNNLENTKENNDSQINNENSYSNNDIIIILTAFILFLIFLIFSNIFPNNDSNALNVINLLVQCEAAIIAIVITLSLVAVQLAAQSYSTRVIEIFKKSNSFRAIIALYISTIIMGVITLISADNGISEIILKKLLLTDYCLGIVAFVSVIPFIWVTFNLLKPTTILEELSKDIKKEKILGHITNKKENEDPLQPIIDILHSSCIKNDYDSFEKGLNIIHDDFIAKIVNNDKLNQEKVINYVLDHYKSIGMAALANNDEKYINHVIDALYLVGMHSANEKELNNDKSNAMAILGYMGKISASKFEITTKNAVTYLKNIHIIALKKNKIIPAQHVANLGYIGQIALERKFDFVADEITGFINEITTETFKHDNQLIINTSLLSLRMIGITALKEDLDLSIEPIINVTRDIGIESIGRYEMSTEIALSVLEDICMVTIEKRLQRRIISSIKSVELIENEVIIQKNKKMIHEGLISLYQIGYALLDHNLEPSMLANLESLEIIGNKLIQQKMDVFALQCVSTLQKFEVMIARPQMENVYYKIRKAYTTLLETAKKNDVKRVIEFLEKIISAQED